jgi:hypothetical protein
MESFYVLISPDFVNSMKEFVTHNVLSDDDTKSNRSIQSSSVSNALQSNIPSPAKSISKYRPLKREKSSSKTITNDQRISFRPFLSHRINKILFFFSST